MIVKTISDDPRKTTVVYTNECRVTEEDQQKALEKAYEEFIKQQKAMMTIAKYLE